MFTVRRHHWQSSSVSAFSPARLQISGHGNFGSIDNDPAAAMRYTECRLEALSSAMLLADLDTQIIKFAPNFDESQASMNLEVQKVLLHVTALQSVGRLLAG